MTEAIVFTIPHRLTRLNEYINTERYNKYAAAKTKQDMTNLCSYYIPKSKIDYPVEVTMIWTVKVMSNDIDNVGFGAKFIMDAMVKKGFIRSDNLTVVKSMKHEFVKGKNEGVKVIVRKWEDDK